MRENLWLKLFKQFQTNVRHIYIYIIYSFYRPPNNLTESVTNLIDSMSKMSTHNPDITIAGDFNFSSIKWEEGILFY